jgi:hypothetical protein
MDVLGLGLSSVRHETPTQGAPDPYTADEFADLCEDDMGAAHNASYRELSALTGMTPREFQAFCEEIEDEPTECTDAMGAL